MPNIASVLKQEIARISRKEVKAETAGLKKVLSRYRTEIAVLKQENAALRKEMARLSKSVSAVGPVALPGHTETQRFRFRAKGFAGHRQRLRLSAEEVGKLMGVSGQTIYHWESGKGRPRARQMPMIAAFRKLGRRTALDVLARR